MSEITDRIIVMRSILSDKSKSLDADEKLVVCKLIREKSLNLARKAVPKNGMKAEEPHSLRWFGHNVPDLSLESHFFLGLLTRFRKNPQRSLAHQKTALGACHFTRHFFIGKLGLPNADYAGNEPV